LLLEAVTAGWNGADVALESADPARPITLAGLQTISTLGCGPFDQPAGERVGPRRISSRSGAAGCTSRALRIPVSVWKVGNL
jgi:hypothetical protein